MSEIEQRAMSEGKKAVERYLLARKRARQSGDAMRDRARLRAKKREGIGNCKLKIGDCKAEEGAA